MKRIFPAVLLLLAAITVMGGKCADRLDNAEERQICDDLSEKLCAKWFDCWPVISTQGWESQSNCEVIVKETCADSDELYDCDVDNDDLEDCNNSVEGSECGQLPASCWSLMECAE